MNSTTISTGDEAVVDLADIGKVSTALLIRIKK